MKLLLISALNQIQPLGLLNVSTYLSENGHDVNVLFLPLSRPETRKEIDQVLNLVKSVSPDIIGLSLMTFNFSRCARLSGWIKSRFPDISIVWGGIHPTLMPEESLHYADMVCLGEGEEAMLELTDKIERGQFYYDTRNFWFKNNGAIIRNGVRPYTSDMDKLPFPRWDWQSCYCLDNSVITRLTFPLYRKHSFGNGAKYNVLMTRGCPFDCAYCCNPYFKRLYSGKGGHIRKRSAEHLMDELVYVKDKLGFVEFISIQDDNFLLSGDEFLDKFAAMYKKHVNLPFTCKSFPEAVTPERTSRLKDAGLEFLQLGIQGSDRVNKDIFKRPCAHKDVLRAAKALREYDVTGRYDVIIDNPYEKKEGLIQIINTLAALPKPYWLQTFSMAFFPSTELTGTAKNDGLFTEDRNGYTFEYGKPGRTYLNRLIAAAPRTPGWLVRLFAAHRDKVWTRALFIIYDMFFIRTLNRFIYKLTVTKPLFVVKIKNGFNRRRQYRQKVYQEG